MPIVDMQFQNDIFFAREVDYVGESDALAWVKALNYHTQINPSRIILLIDATEATTISNAARKIFAQASDTPNVQVAAVAVNPENMRGAQHSRITALLASIRKTHETYFFDSLEEAIQFIRQYVDEAAYN